MTTELRRARTRHPMLRGPRTAERAEPLIGRSWLRSSPDTTRCLPEGVKFRSFPWGEGHPFYRRPSVALNGGLLSALALWHHLVGTREHGEPRRFILGRELRALSDVRATPFTPCAPGWTRSSLGRGLLLYWAPPPAAPGAQRGLSGTCPSSPARARRLPERGHGKGTGGVGDEGRELAGSCSRLLGRPRPRLTNFGAPPAKTPQRSPPQQRPPLGGGLLPAARAGPQVRWGARLSVHEALWVRSHLALAVPPGGRCGAAVLSARRGALPLALGQAGSERGRRVRALERRWSGAAVAGPWEGLTRRSAHLGGGNPPRVWDAIPGSGRRGRGDMAALHSRAGSPSHHRYAIPQLLRPAFLPVRNRCFLSPRGLGPDQTHPEPTLRRDPGTFPCCAVRSSLPLPK
ncbi:uncharacterized protein LOC116421002 [Sarcophilus harrisii]|uniref:uncharacterized protein LOC116421002 n=1 Tax=Sarcophilus harrisii TaxID=9305 RepID=UPI001301E2E8|nr:uncharacterized protein LOC116421002 [Sarcophilus harrisii]